MVFQTQWSFEAMVTDQWVGHGNQAHHGVLSVLI